MSEMSPKGGALRAKVFSLWTLMMAIVLSLVFNCAYSFQPRTRLVVRDGAFVSKAVSEKTLIEVKGPFDSPSVRKLQKDPSEFVNPFDSPSCKMNGVDTDRK